MRPGVRSPALRRRAGRGPKLKLSIANWKFFRVRFAVLGMCESSNPPVATPSPGQRGACVWQTISRGNMGSSLGRTRGGGSSSPHHVIRWRVHGGLTRVSLCRPVSGRRGLLRLRLRPSGNSRPLSPSGKAACCLLALQTVAVMFLSLRHFASRRTSSNFVLRFGR